MPSISRLGLLLAAMLAASPANAAVEISSRPTANMSCSSGVCTPTAKKAVLNVNDLATMLASGDTTIKSTSENPDIEIDAPVSWASGRLLTLDSYHSIAFNKAVFVAGSGSLTITTNQGGGDGDYRFFKDGHVQFRNLQSNLSINGEHYELVQNFRQIEAKHGSLLRALAKSIDLSEHGAYSSAPLKHGPLYLEGLGNVISHLTINDQKGRDDVGLFVGPPNIRDLSLVDVDIQGGVGACVGAFGGENYDLQIIANSHVTGRISGGDGSTVGGILCDNEFGTIAGSSSAASVSGGVGSTVGGLLGVNISSGDTESWLSDSYSTGTVSGGDNAIVGGVIGNNFGGVVSNVYATGPISGGNYSFIGGLVGSANSNQGEESISEIFSSYSTGAVTGGAESTVGGLVGSDVAESQNISNYWNLDTSGVSNPAQGAGNFANDPGIMGLSDAQLKAGLPAGFDKSIWKESAKLNSGYPYLIDNPPPK